MRDKGIKVQYKEAVDYCSKYKKYKVKPTKPAREKTPLEQMCDYYYLDEKLVKGYARTYPNLSLQQILEVYLPRKKKNLDLLKTKLKEIKGEKPLSLLKLDTRTYRALSLFGIDTLEQLQIVPICIIKNIPGIGEKSVNNIIENCNKIGLHLREY